MQKNGVIAKTPGHEEREDMIIDLVRPGVFNHWCGIPILPGFGGELCL